MKVILNKDLSPLGEEGDVKEVAKGYARNFLFPRGIAVPYNDRTVKLFESRKEEIEARKAEKRNDAAGLKEKLEALVLEITMPAGANGKLYGAVTSQTIADELAKQGHHIERKRIELAGSNFKSVGKYKAAIKLYESAAAEITITIVGQEIKTESRTPAQPARGKRRRDADIVQADAVQTDTVQAEAAAPEAPAGNGAPVSEPAAQAAPEIQANPEPAAAE
ncbi:50S ribosomal protein L9 [Leadbettera azotonutricia]|uniref:Large ribosomal subunit protein bL9 n=1 Tax=Leadbettera azotonutricia (strain ATCC BAA-888 / DSM 13862 / ZAS-9) TaxID=545695 RepID=F5YB01_LEAAZ|nr:50S ribosomal protein L9 [Leadbettera azotonutricia]AEF80921.1 50S ribosomal protein L9 [Leadbettera azotonutricia ZAS-9]